MDLLKSISELEDLVANSKRFPLMDKCMVDEEAFIRIINEIRDQWPSALKEAEEITSNRDKIIEDAREEAKNIVAQAKAYAQKQVNEDAITVAAKAKANDILAKTYAHSETMRNESVQYAGQVLDHVILYLQNAMSTMEGGLNTIETAKKNINEIKNQPITPPQEEAQEEQEQTQPEETK